VDELDGLPIIAFPAAGELEGWLRENHARASGLWLKLAKKDSAIESVSYAEALEHALCFGWIDGQKRAFDERFWLQRFTPRGPRSRWSRINREKAERLIEQGRMQAAGAEQVERARGDGRWERAYEGQRTATVPADLQRELDRNPVALAFFQTLNSVNRYAIIYRIGDAKRPQTRARRIAKFVAMLEAHERIHP
jgi:uncharacterized protein YdeI (YjbR/CyaY-like superfamily)